MRVSRLIAMAMLGLMLVLAFSGSARADIFKVEQDNGSCQSLTQAVADCNGSSPWQLSTLLQVLSTPNILDSLGEGTDVFRVTNNIANSWSFELDSTGQNDTGVANNGSCQISGGATAFFDACMIMDSLGQTTDLGGTQISNLTFPATISFSGADDFGQTFQLEFVSMQGTSNTVPEPATIRLLGSGLLGLILVGARRRRMLES